LGSTPRRAASLGVDGDHYGLPDQPSFVHGWSFLPDVPQVQNRSAPVTEPLVHEDGDGIDLQALRAPSKGSVRGWVATTNNIHPKRLLRRRPEKVYLNAEIVLLGELVHPCQRAFNHLHNGRDFHPRVGAEN
jgi:hypothetical protein